MPQVMFNHFHFSSGDSGASGGMFWQRCQPTRNYCPVHLCSCLPPYFQQNWAASLVCPSQVPPQPLSTGTASPTVTPCFSSTPHFFPCSLSCSLPRIVSTQFQPHKKSLSSSGHPTQPSACGSRGSRCQWADPFTTLTATWMLVFTLWYVKYCTWVVHHCSVAHHHLNNDFHSCHRRVFLIFLTTMHIDFPDLLMSQSNESSCPPA